MLFVAGVFLVPLLLISINYSAISDLRILVPLSSLVVERDVYLHDPDIFSKTQNKKDSTCFTAPSDNIFCYEKPRMDQRNGISYTTGDVGIDGRIGNVTIFDSMHGVSYVSSAARIDGKLHFEQVDGDEGPYLTMKKITRIQGDTASMTFADKNYSRGGNNGTAAYAITDKFEFSVTVQKYDTFIAACSNYQGTAAHLVQYLGVTTIDGVDYFMTWHTIVASEKGIACDYPEIIRASLRHNFGA